jgi:hypothetical protein
LVKIDGMEPNRRVLAAGSPVFEAELFGPM